ncbi:hypothetical protein [Roseomonas rosulenta]|uniref:hypothetical protein n=1 Tax=Roseomonas rosulenta TaxID=2748667 RepID=UPI0018DF9BD8|nr:hypothetical protein [Roseomonas rosulenta]
MVRLALVILTACGLGGCVWAFEPIRYVIEGPNTSAQVVEAGRPLQAEDRLALVVTRPRAEAGRVAACVAAGLGSRLPGGHPSPVVLEAEAAARVLAMVEPLLRGEGFVRTGGALPPEVGTLGFDWLVVVEDHSSDDATTGVDRSLVPGRSNLGRQEVRVGRTVRYRLALLGTLLDIRGRRLLGTVWGSFETQGGAYLIVSGTSPFAAAAAPMIEVPAGTGAMTICSAFGRSVGDAVLRAAPPLRQPPEGDLPPS